MLQLIREFKEKPTTSEEDVSNLAWTMELIAREQLYTVHFGEKSGASSHMTTEMTDWMRSNLQVSIGGAHPDRRTRESTIKPSGRETAGRETDTEGSSAHGGKRNTVLSKVRGLTIGGAGTGGVHDHAAGMHSALAEGSAKEVVEELPWLSTLLNDTRVARMLELSEDWKAFDVFELCEATGNRPIVVGGMHILQRHGILDKLGVKAATMANYLDALERGYVGSNPFHNNVHAADVMFTLNYFLGRPLFREMVGPLDKFGALLAALAHDFAHPGVSNAFLMTTRSEEAVLYNDQSVLEMFHAAGSWRLLLTSSECNVTEGFTPEMYKQMRETHIAMILATGTTGRASDVAPHTHSPQLTLLLPPSTDLKVHFEHLGRLKTRIATDAFVSVERKDVLFLLGQALHAADISNPAKAQHLQIKWTQRVMKEFFLQGDRENELGLPISAFMDRQKTSIAQCQMGFISVLVKPLYAEWRKLLGDDLQPAIDLLQLSLSGWETDGNKLCEGWDL